MVANIDRFILDKLISIDPVGIRSLDSNSHDTWM